MRIADGTLHLGGEYDAVPNARRFATETLSGADLDELMPDAELVVSELVTNAILHGSPPVTLRVEVRDDTVRIEVFDGSRSAPVRALARADAMTGRGLSLVAALARDWGVEPRPGGKVVWSELGPGAAPETPIADADIDAILAGWDDEELDTVRRYTVSLGDVPTDLLVGAKAHVDNLVREFTLAARGAESGRTAAVPPQLAELIEAVVTGFAEARQAIKRQALDSLLRGTERTTLTLTLPLDAADAGEHYLTALDEADAYARAARLLTLETPPQHRVFRHWYVESLVSQLRHAAAGEPADPQVTFERRLLDELAVVAVARRGAERAARLQTVTAALAATTSAEDVGNAVVSEGVEALGASGGGVLTTADESHLAVTAVVGYAEPVVERLRAERLDAALPAAAALRSGEAVWLESREEIDAGFPELTDLEPGTVSICAVPLRAGNRVLGALRFSFDVPRLFDADERRFVLTLAAETAGALERAYAYAALSAANDKLSFLAEASVALSATLDYQTTLHNVAHLAVPRLADRCAVHVLDDGQEPLLAVTHPRGQDAPISVTNVLLTGTSELYPVLPEGPVASALVVPLTARQRIFGAVTMCYAESGRHYDSGDLAVAEDLARRASLAIDNAVLYLALQESERQR